MTAYRSTSAESGRSTSVSHPSWRDGGALILAARDDGQHDLRDDSGRGPNEPADSLVDALLEMDIDGKAESKSHTASTARTGANVHAAKIGGVAGAWFG